MKLIEVIDLIKRIAFSQPNIGDCFVGSVTELNERQDVNYPAVVITQDTHYIDKQSETEKFNFYIFAVDRLTSDKENKEEIHSWANELLIDILNELEYLGIPTYNTSTVETFTQKFDSICAGAFIKTTFQVFMDTCDNEFKVVTSVNGMTGDVKIETTGATEEWVKNTLDLDYYTRDEVERRIVEVIEEYLKNK